jgi:site-specific recombinase XerD
MQAGHTFCMMAGMIERAGETEKLPFPVRSHMLRHRTGYALAGRGNDARRLQHFLGHASVTNTVRLHRDVA